MSSKTNKKRIQTEYTHGSPDEIEMSRCPECGHDIPTLNMALHQATVCGRNRPQRSERTHAFTSQSPCDASIPSRRSHAVQSCSNLYDSGVSNNDQMNEAKKSESKESDDGDDDNDNDKIMAMEDNCDSRENDVVSSPPRFRAKLSHVEERSESTRREQRDTKGEEEGLMINSDDSSSSSSTSSPASTFSVISSSPMEPNVSVISDNRSWIDTTSGTHASFPRDTTQPALSTAHATTTTMEATGEPRTVELPLAKETQIEGEEVIHLDDSEEEEDDILDAQWACPRCTLLNAMDNHQCEACGYTQQRANIGNDPQHFDPNTTHFSNIRSPDPTLTERLIGMDPRQFPFAFVSSQSFDCSGNTPPNASPNNGGVMRSIGGSAILGSAIGAISGLSRNRGFLSSALEGAVAGAVGGAISRTLSSQRPPPSSMTIPIARAAGSSSHGNSTAQFASHPNNVHTLDSFESSSQPQQQQEPPRQNRQPSQPTMVHSMGRTYRITAGPGFRVIVTSGSFPMHGMHMVEGRDLLDGMGYEHLLELFGDGTEHRSTDPAIIRSLPTTTLQNVDKELPMDQRQCAICLEQFQNGEKRKTLQCLHGFHEECIDKWLRSSRSCPICKFDVQS